MPLVGVVTVLQSGEPPGVAAQAVLAIEVTPAGRGLSTASAKLAPVEEPAGRAGRPRVQVLPGPMPGAQVQPAVLEPAAKVVLGGTVSVNVNAAASWLPVLATASE